MYYIGSSALSSFSRDKFLENNPNLTVLDAHFLYFVDLERPLSDKVKMHLFKLIMSMD